MLFTDEELGATKNNEPIVDIKINEVPLFFSSEEKTNFAKYCKKLFKPYGVDNASDLIIKLLKERYENTNP